MYKRQCLYINLSVLLPVGYLHVGGDCSLSPEFRRITFLLPASFHCGMMNSHSLLLRRPFCFIQPESLELSSAGSMNLNQVYQSQLLHASFFTQLPEISYLKLILRYYLCYYLLSYILCFSADCQMEPHIFKMGISTDNNKFHIRVLDTRPFQKLHSIISGHPDIRQHQIRCSASII